MSVAERWILSGRVQGVGYREWMVAAARRAALRGLVRNRPDGTVEVLVAADRQDALDALAARSRDGPPGSEVLAVSRLPMDDRDLPDPFERG